jgi:amino acid adenylation domain-containing protein
MTTAVVQQTYHRPISRVERWFLAYPEWVPAVIQLFVEGDGELEPERLRRAAEAASAACPGTRLVRRGQRWVDSGVAPVVRVVDGDLIDRRTFAGAPDLHRPLTGDGEPTCEILLLTGAAPGVVFRGFHGALDGRGVVVWAAEVFRALRGEALSGAPDRLDETAFAARFGVPAVNADMSRDWPSIAGRREASGRRPFFWRRRTVAGNHPALVAKVAAVLNAAGGRPAGRFMVPVDLRRHDPAVRSTANLVQNLQLDTVAGEGWEEIHQRLITMLAERRDLATQVDGAISSVPLAALRTQVQAIDDQAVRTDRYPAQATVSHLGRQDLADFCADGFRATTVYALPNPGPAGPPEFDIAEVPGRTELTVGWFDEPHLVERVEELLDRIEDALSPRTHRDWAGNATDVPHDLDTTVVARLWAQIARTPGATALHTATGPVTFAELGARADAVAALLRRNGVGRGDVVGLLAERTADAMAAIWGVMKLGAAYLPLDTQHPDDRLAGLLTDAGAPVCLVQRPHDDRGCVPAGCRALGLDDVPPAGAPVPIAAAPGDLAYIIYTSGSTGRPKGVEVDHRNLANFVEWASRVYRIDAGTRFPLFTSLAFDLSNTALFTPLLAGGSIILVREAPDHLVLRDVLERSGATVLKVTPTHLDLIGRLGLTPAGFRTVIAGGELLRVAVAARAQEMFGPGCGIFNEYGPTETTIGCTTRRFDAERDAGAASVPIGLPGDNTKIFLLDPEGRYVAPGETGEMYISGAQVARGYRGRPDLNRERFVTLPGGARAYRTGDLARLLPDGELESLGRNDEQIKVHGYRIEPGEIAHVLEEHPAVRRAVVVGRARPGQTDRQLIGYVVASGPIGEAELHAHLADRLPGYMVPAATLLLPEFPHTPNGKVDTEALPDPFAATAGACAPVTAAADEVEAGVRAVWASILAADPARLGVDADFHRLGGDSLSLLAMAAGVCREVVGGEHEREFMRRLSTVLEQPTLGRVAALARELRAG